MKKPFNATASQTYASREAELEAHARKIDEFLRTPKKPGIHFTPSGEMRRNAQAHAHNALTQKRVDINKELESIKQDMAKRQELEKSKTYAKSL
jgi:hypothetical protein